MNRSDDYVDLYVTAIASTVVDLVPADFARENRVMPVWIGRGVLIIAIENLLEFELFDKVRFVLNRRVDFVRAQSAAIDFAIRKYYP